MKLLHFESNCSLLLIALLDSSVEANLVNFAKLRSVKQLLVKIQPQITASRYLSHLVRQLIILNSFS